MKTSEYYIELLKMEPHIEGGFFKSSYHSKENITLPQGKDKPTTERSLWTSIYFLLKDGEVSHLHRLKSDEMWYFHDGSSLTIYMISPVGELTTHELGLNIEKGEKPQILVPKDYIFGSAMNNPGFSLVGCMVSPGFDFNDFELFTRDYLLNLYPEHKNIITKLTR